MGIKDRDSVGSPEEETTEQVPVDPAQLTPVVAATGETVALHTSSPAEPLAWEALFLPLLLAPNVAALTVEAPPAVASEEPCPVCGGAVPATTLTAETAAPLHDAGFGLSALALGGFLSFLRQTHKKERREADEDE